MKNVKIINHNQVICANEKYHIALTNAGIAVCKSGWKSFPSESAWVNAGGVAEDRTALLSACNSVHAHLSQAIVNSAIYGAETSCVARVKCNDHERNAIEALRSIVAMLGARVDRVGHVKRNAFVVDGTSIKGIYVLCAGRNLSELCSQGTFAKKLVPWLIYRMRGDAIAVANDEAREENRADKSDKSDKANAKAPSKEEALAVNQKLAAEKALLAVDNRKLKETLKQVRAYAIEHDLADLLAIVGE